MVKQQTDFPYGDTTRLTLVGKGKFDINVRVPAWAQRGFSSRSTAGRTGQNRRELI